MVIVSGALIALRFRSLDNMLATDWGWAILVGLIATLGAIVVGLGFTSPAGKKMAAMDQALEGRPPTAEEAQAMGKQSQRLVTLGRLSTGLLVLAIFAMAAARFV